MRGAESRGSVRDAGLLLGGPLARSRVLIRGVEVARYRRVGSLARRHIRIGGRREFGRSMALEGRFMMLDVWLLQGDLVGLDGALERVESICEFLDVTREMLVLRALERSGSRTLCWGLSSSGPD